MIVNTGASATIGIALAASTTGVVGRGELDDGAWYELLRDPPA
jgi:hypothetical protein